MTTESKTNESPSKIRNLQEEIKLFSGLKLISSTKLFEKFLDICYCNDTREFLVLDDGLKVHRYSLDGQKIHPSFTLNPSMLFTKIIWCSSIKSFACYALHDDTFWLLDQEFKLIQTIKTKFRIKNLFFSSPELIVISSTSVTRYLQNKSKLAYECYQTINTMDTNYGPIWSMQYSSLIATTTESLKLAVSYLTTMYIVPLSSEEDENAGLYVKFLTTKLNATASAITALYFHPASNWIITGDLSGNVYAWTTNLDRVFNHVGHKGAIKSIISHPSICGFLTSSSDDILQVWSCNFKDKTEYFANLGSINAIAINESSSVVTLGTKLTFFFMHQLYLFYSPLLTKASILQSTQNLRYPIRIIVSSSDHSISVLSSASGKQINAIILSTNVEPVSIASSSISGDIYVVPLITRNILILNSNIFPMKIKNSWTSEKLITTVVVYDHYSELIINQTRTINPISVRIFAGTNKGELVSIDESTGKFQQIIQAHNGPIKKLCISNKSHHIFSIAEDWCIKFWKIFPYITNPLAFSYCIYLTTPVINIASVGFSVCVISANGSRDQLFMYDVKKKIKYENNLSNDHKKRILDISTLESLKICATSSEDFTIKIWNEQNILLRIIEVNLIARRLTFSSLRGDIIFSVAKHLYILPHENYLPREYKEQIKIKNISEEEEEDLVAKDEDEYLDYEENEIKSRVLHPVSSVPLCSLALSSEVPRLDALVLEQKGMHLRLRERDIKAIELGIAELSERRKKMKKKKAVMNYEDWEKYVDGLAKEIEEKKRVEDKFNEQKREIFDKSQDCKLKIFEWLSKMIPNSLVRESKKEEDKSEAPIEKKIYKYEYPENLDKNSDEDLLSLPLLEDLNKKLNDTNE
ncbi:hypothetical protein KQX54_007002 [Cotesia glomerata]|uniref:Uncharacterized protein n=2 Tax=Cotesia glomerata TaxID=32391 RepID=A0AAV7I7K5_COTGL|nr:hypothetical protein KQX54_007002 [Cotesia glomerata]